MTRSDLLRVASWVCFFVFCLFLGGFIGDAFRQGHGAGLVLIVAILVVFLGAAWFIADVVVEKMYR